MKPSEYVEAAMRTDLSHEQYAKVLQRLSNPTVLRLLHAGMGLCTEAGEYQDQLKRHLFYGKELDLTNLAEEVGDTFWYSALSTDAMNKKEGTTAEQIMAGNIAKLFKRYPDKFDEVSALVRDILKEREAVEENISTS